MAAEKDGWQAWLQNGRLSTVAWVLVFITYIVFRIMNISDPAMTNAFVTVTGVWVGNLGIAQSKKQSRVEEKADHAVTVAESAQETATGSIPVLKEDGTVQEPPRIHRPGGKK